jgi:hypothetical protein
VRQRVALLPEAGQRLLEVAAIGGQRVPQALLMAAAGQPEDAVLVGLEAACRAHLLEEEGADYNFAHDVIREVKERLPAVRSHVRTPNTVNGPATPRHEVPVGVARSAGAGAVPHAWRRGGVQPSVVRP